ncbi:MAG: hypothetical protein KIT11_02965 [Fimbriimonadaceae bacterium]|nr:hypothetical protein [Fimbriimonadaceae bacterium]QYK54671.1 MAG: hypothetical protein KF733_06560 [Fimbriimonadaceae bacterium]
MSRGGPSNLYTGFKAFVAAGSFIGAALSGHGGGVAIRTDFSIEPLQIKPVAGQPITLEGHGKPGYIVRLSANEMPISTGERNLTVSDEGTWAFEWSPRIAGEVLVEALFLDPVSKTEVAHQERSIEVPGESSPIQLKVPDPKNPTVEPGKTLVSGIAEPKSRLQVRVNNALWHEITADAGGRWQVVLNLRETGLYELEVEAVGRKGQRIAMMEKVPLRVEKPGESVDDPKFEISGVLRRPQTKIVQVRGQGKPGSRVSISVDGDDLGETTIQNSGEWVADVPPRHSDPTSVTARLLNEKGDTVEKKEFNAPGRPAERPAPPTGPEMDTPRNGANLPQGMNKVSGKAKPGQSVEVIVGARRVGRFPVGANGEWEGYVKLLPGKQTAFVQVRNGAELVRTRAVTWNVLK